ncbi:MAG: hypothetical protein FWG14_04850 [Peptococcaceae bacterium]|nr:hypothetical protein [Peptococcaceae bacterium]
MVDFVYDLFKTILVMALFIALLFLAEKVNLPRQKRSRQVMLPLAAGVYCVIAVLLTDPIREGIASAMTGMGKYIPIVASLTQWLDIIVNAVLVGVFLMIKKTVLLPKGDREGSKAGAVLTRISGKFYEYNERMNTWVLKDEFGQAKILWRGFYGFAVGISSLILVLSHLYPGWEFFRAPFYPVFGILVMGEILYFLSGLTYQEIVTSIGGDNEEYDRITNYGMLRRVFRDIYDDRILFDDTADTLSELSTFDMLDTLSDSANTQDLVISEYFTRLQEKGRSVDAGFVRSCIDMVNGKSVLINVPFYQDLTAYLMLPLVRRLLSYEKALVIVGRDSAAEDVRNWIHKGIAGFCGTPELWKTDILTKRKAECDVAVLRFADVYNREVLDVNTEFLNQVGFVVLIEPSRAISTGQIGLSLIVDQLGKGSEDIVYCSCDRNCDGLVDSLSHILKVNLTEVYATVTTLANCALMHWDAHGDFLHHKILPNIAHYLGMGTELAAVALRNQIAGTVWVSSDRFPVLDMRWIVGQYHKSICTYIRYPQSQEALAEVFQVEDNLWNLSVWDNAFLIVEDEFNNLFEMTRLYSTRAKKQGFVNVISENYLLRDYMADNAAIFTADSKVIPSMVSDYTRSEKNTVVELIMRMFGGGVSENELKHKLSLAGIEFDDPYTRFCELVAKHCYVDAVGIVPFYQDESSEDGMQPVKAVQYTIHNNDTKLADYARRFSNAYFIIEDDKDKNYYLGAMLYGQVFQKYLPGQFLTYAGKYYQVQTITPESGVVLRRAADHITDRKAYRQRREYFLSGFTLDPAMGSCSTRRGVELSRGFCDIRVMTHGYYELTSLDDLASGHCVDLNSIPDRMYKNKAILCLKLSGVSAEVRFTTALLFNEIFVTLYPESYPYLTAAVKKPTDISSNILEAVSSAYLEDGDDGGDELIDGEGIYIIEDCDIDLGLLVSFERNLTRVLEIVADCLAWYDRKLEGTAGLVDKDSNRILKYGTHLYGNLGQMSSSRSNSCFILYGYESVDPMLNIQETLSFLSLHGYDKNVLQQARGNSGLAAQTGAEIDFAKPDAHFCDFCAVELSGGEYDVLADGRERCTQCSNSSLKTVEKFAQLYEYSLRNMEAFFGIRINAPIRVRMTDAGKMANLCGQKFVPSPGYSGRTLAFAKKDADGYSIYVENGAPKIAAMANIVHELTHIWQFINWDKEKISARYGIDEPLVYEGMAKWAEIQYLFSHDASYAKRQEIYTRGRKDAYGRGFITYAKQYPLEHGSGYQKTPPFHKEWPLELPL